MAGATEYSRFTKSTTCFCQAGRTYMTSAEPVVLLRELDMIGNFHPGLTWAGTVLAFDEG